MVRSWSSETNYSESNESPLRHIFYEFYNEKSVKNLVDPDKVYERILALMEKYLKKRKIEKFNSTNRVKTMNQVLFAYCKMKFEEFEGVNGKKKFLEFVNSGGFSKVFFIFCKFLFSRNISYLVRKLKVRCCTNDKHFSFCKAKWASLEKFCLMEFPSYFFGEPVMTCFIEEIVAEVLPL